MCQTPSQAHFIENALIPIFGFWGKIGGYSILQLYAYNRFLGTSFDFLTAVIGPWESLLVFEPC